MNFNDFFAKHMLIGQIILFLTKLSHERKVGQMLIWNNDYGSVGVADLSVLLQPGITSAVDKVL